MPDGAQDAQSFKTSNTSKGAPSGLLIKKIWHDVTL